MRQYSGPFKAKKMQEVAYTKNYTPASALGLPAHLKTDDASLNQEQEKDVALEDAKPDGQLEFALMEYLIEQQQPEYATAYPREQQQLGQPSHNNNGYSHETLNWNESCPPCPPTDKISPPENSTSPQHAGNNTEQTSITDQHLTNKFTHSNLQHL